jgi:hypothetical protein
VKQALVASETDNIKKPRSKSMKLFIFGIITLITVNQFQAIKVDDGWFITGSLQKGWRGGTAEAVIRVDDGLIINISHGK